MLIRQIRKSVAVQGSDVNSLFAPGMLGIRSDFCGGEQPGREMVLGRIYVLSAALDRVVVLVAGHPGDVEEDPAHGVRDPGLEGAETLDEFLVTLASWGEERKGKVRVQFPDLEITFFAIEMHSCQLTEIG